MSLGGIANTALGTRGRGALASFQRKANTAINRVNPKKKPPIKRGTHQSEGSSILERGFLAHPRMPCGYMSAQAPAIPREIRPSGNIHFQGASTNKHNVARTIARTILSATFIRRKSIRRLCEILDDWLQSHDYPFCPPPKSSASPGVLCRQLAFPTPLSKLCE